MFVLNAKSCTILGTNFGRISRFLLGWKTFTPFWSKCIRETAYQILPGSCEFYRRCYKNIFVFFSGHTVEKVATANDIQLQDHSTWRQSFSSLTIRPILHHCAKFQQHRTIHDCIISHHEFNYFEYTAVTQHTYRSLAESATTTSWCTAQRSRFTTSFYFIVKTTESVHCTITGPCLRMRHRPSARTLQHVTVPIRNIYLQARAGRAGF